MAVRPFAIDQREVQLLLKALTVQINEELNTAEEYNPSSGPNSSSDIQLVKKISTKSVTRILTTMSFRTLNLSRNKLIRSKTPGFISSRSFAILGPYLYLGTASVV